MFVSEYKNLLERKTKIEKELQTLVQGYISNKTINGKTYRYLQNRINENLTSKYLKNTEADMVAEQILRRKEYEKELPKLTARISELEQAARLIGKSTSRQLMLMRLSTGMDSLTAEEKKQSISFASAMNAVEGIPVSEQTAQDISAWQNGNEPFYKIFEATLKRYGFPVGV